MSEQTVIERGEETFYKTYNRFPVVFDHGKGVWLYDEDGEAYLDFGAGIAVMGLGYGDPEFTQAVKDQADKLLHISNLFYSRPAVEAGEKLLAASGMDRVFFTNSGTEAIEGALKVARRYAYNKDHGHDHEIIAMHHSFHGRSMGALSVTGNDHYQEPFKPLIPGIRFADFNDLDSVKALINDKTCAIIMETIQGEGGIYPAAKEFLEGVRKLCDEHDMLLILDEIQCGMGRTGHMFAWQGYGVKPDVMTTAKALGNGLPVGAFLAWGKAAQAMGPGDHGTTYGGGGAGYFWETGYPGTRRKNRRISEGAAEGAGRGVRFGKRTPGRGADSGPGIYLPGGPHCDGSPLKAEAGVNQRRLQRHPLCAAADY